jgi:hypothetical protein
MRTHIINGEDESQVEVLLAELHESHAKRKALRKPKKTNTKWDAFVTSIEQELKNYKD